LGFDRYGQIALRACLKFLSYFLLVPFEYL
jgi:hypothetical protein